LSAIINTPRALTNTEAAFLSLIRRGINHSAADDLIVPDWMELQALATRQGLAAILMDGIEQLPLELRPPKVLLLQWIGEVLQNYEQRYSLYQRAIAEMAGFFNEHHYKMMILKGYACSLDWPKPEHRLCGDIDIWLFGKSREADFLLEREKGIEVNRSEPHHTVSYWRDFMVEDHFDFIDVNHHRSHRALEKTLKELGKDDTHSVELNGETVYIPSPNLHALFLQRHSMLHFAFGKFSLRQLLDWAFFVKAHGQDVDWKWLMSVLEQHGMTPLFNLFNAICIEDLGFEAELFPRAEVDPVLKQRVLNEIFIPEFNEQQPSSLIPRVLFKYRRWKANGWKHALCYKESMRSAFWSGVWGHMLKPASI
jgi:hypothetical protein